MWWEGGGRAETWLSDDCVHYPRRGPLKCPGGGGESPRGRWFVSLNAMKNTMKLLVLLMCSLAVAAPMRRSSLDRRQVATLCDQFGYWSGNGYEINNNNWGKASATSGSQCTYVDGSSSTGVSWHTTWTWTGGNGVKSYANSGRQIPKGHTIASINSMPTSVSWQYNTSSIRANVAYDFFTAEDPNHAKSSGDYELMIW